MEAERRTRIEELEGEKRSLEARRERLELPAIDRETLSGIPSEFEETMAKGTNPQKKHLLRRVVKTVLIHDRRMIEVWYCLPNRTSVRAAEYMASPFDRLHQTSSQVAAPRFNSPSFEKPL